MPNPAIPIPPQIFHRTNAHEGWREVFSPETGAMRCLTYARLVFGPTVRTHTLDTADREWVLFCIAAPVTVTSAGAAWTLAARDMLYLPRNCVAVISGEPGADLALGGCPAHIDTLPQAVRFADIKDDPAFFFDVGTTESATKRRIFNMLGHNVSASRLLAGFTIGDPSAWTSWPPHEHTDSREEFYLFFDMPPPAFSVQFIYSSTDAMEFKEVVRDSDCVTVPGGYHPTAAAPGASSVFLWVMAAFDPAKDRDFKYGIHIQPEYAAVKFV